MLVTKEQDVPIINGRCGDLLGLPSDYIARPPRFDKIVEHQAGAIGDKEPSDSLGLAAGLIVRGGDGSGDTSLQGMSVCERTLPNGTIVEVRTTNLPDGSFVQTFSDVTKRCEAEAHVARLASEDPLTGLPNRRLFQSVLDQLCARTSAEAMDAGAPTAFAVLFLDLDRFKIVNDTLGHGVGDLLLLQVAERLKGRLETGQSLARLGGDEFALVVTDDASRPQLAALAKRLVRCGLRALRDRRSSHQDRRQHRDRGGSAGRHHRRRPADGLRSGALFGQGDRTRHAPVLRPFDERGGQGAAADRGRSPRRDGARRLRAALPAHHRHQPQQRHRLRGAGAMAASREGTDSAVAVHPYRGRDRPDHSTGRLGPA